MDDNIGAIESIREYWRPRLNKAEAENDRLRRALDLLGVPAQATKDPDKAAPLRITVEIAKRAMGVINE